MEKTKKRSPWSWIPSLYFAEGLPYIAVNTISVILFKRMGVSNTDIALYTSWLYLPWVIKPFWSPFVDLIKTKRWWITAMQFIMSIGFILIALALPTSFFFQLCLIIFWLIGFSSATHDIAADGFYMLALNSHDQANYVGIRSTFYRIATVFGQGVLVIVAGVLEMATGKEPVNLTVQASPEYVNEIVLPTLDESNGFRYAGSDHEAAFTIYPETLMIGANNISKSEAAQIKQMVQRANKENGFTEETEPKGGGEMKDTDQAGAVAVAAVRLNKAPEEGKSIVLNTTFKDGDKSIFLVGGERLEFNESNWDKTALIAVQLDPKLSEVTEASFRGVSGNIPLAWSITFIVLAAVFFLFTIYHRFILPRPVKDKPAVEVTAKTLIKEFGVTFATFFKKKNIWVAILFMLLYRFPEAQLVKLVNPFLLDSKDLGGLGLTTGQVGVVYGTIGIIGLTVGGILGGMAAARGGLKKWLWPMVCAISLPNIMYVILAYTQTNNFLLINTCVFIEQFGYGFGFTAYMLYMIYVSEGEYKTAHYAICTAFMALGMMIPGMFAGWIQEKLGYLNFFWWVMLCVLITFVVTAFIKIDPKFGKKEAES